MSIPLTPSKPALPKTVPTAPKPSEKSAAKPSVKPAERLVSLDAYRGFIMLAMASGGLGLGAAAEKVNAKALAEKLPKNETLDFLASQVDHVPWVGCVFWDLIQPAFMFMVGVSMAYSYASRQARGQGYPRMFGHALFRSIVLVLLGVFLTSNWSKQTNFVFTNVLCQIGLGYTFLFLLWNRPPVWQFAAAVLILLADWGLFMAYPAPPADFDFGKVGVPADWKHLTGGAAHWDKNTNVAADADRVFLNWFPQEKKFEFNGGGYTTLNFVPSLATMIFGLLAGGLMRSERGAGAKLGWLVVSGLVCLGVGYALGRYDICPLVKRIWTPSWAIYSTGWVLLMLAGFYLVVDVIGLRLAALPLVVVGMNSILIYCMAQLIGGWISQTLQRHFGEGLFTFYGVTFHDQRFDPNYAPIVQMSLVLLVMWLVCVWLYRQRIFVRI
ncbi:MAG TPA: heparan-alpha-glucosaminide N-acetyltransferase domain-containing protein [Pirellulales bacterium]|nr:heparan-alpha-glucosaminide N-acetyltransferase domain-containing protein [Pirellulales bacterium]